MTEMDETHNDEWLDQQLRDAAPYIDDDGFTARVLQRLPAPSRQRQSLRAVILIGMAMLASMLAYVLSDSGRFVNVALERFAMLPMLWIFAVALGTGILVTTVGVIAAISKTSELQS
jgi:hypothetical protein